MSSGQPKKPSPEVPGKSTLELKIERTALERDRVTNRLLSSLIPANKSVRKFIEDACKFAKITPPKQGDPLAPYVYKLQKKVCKFKLTDTANGCDGKLGPITFTELLKELPQLAKGYSKQARIGKHKAQRQGLATLMGAPRQTVDAKRGDFKKTKQVGDSLTYQLVHYSKDRAKFRAQNKRFFKGGRSVITMRKKLERNPKLIDNTATFTLWAGANDIYYRSPERIHRETERIIEIILSRNPNAKIALLTLHGDTFRGFRKKQATVKRKISRLNTLIRKTGQKHANNVKVIEMRREIYSAEGKGKRVLAPDKLHLTVKGARAIDTLLKDEIQNGTHGPLTSYMA
ncbi:SGNH/GDSL hydrolase family protein [Patescibacteria group bacterium]